MTTRFVAHRARVLRISGALSAVAVIALALASPTPRAQAQDFFGRPCVAGTLRGDYGLQVTGVRRVPPPLGSGTEHFVATAMWTFNGNGTFTQHGGAAMHGEVTGIAADVGEVAGTYQLNENCTGSMALFVPDLPFPVQYSMVVVDTAHEIRGAIMNPGVGTAELVKK